MPTRLVIPRLLLSRCLGRLLHSGQTTASLPVVQTRTGNEPVLLVSGVPLDDGLPQTPPANVQRLELSIADARPTE